MSISQNFSLKSSNEVRPPRETSAETDSLQNDRALMDQITLTRTVALQLSLRVMAAVAATSDRERVRVVKEYSEYQELYLETLSLLFGKQLNDSDLSDEKVAWVRKVAAQNDQERTQFLACGEKVKSTGQRLEVGDIPTFKEATQFYDSVFPATFECMKQILETLWDDLDFQKGDIEGARQTLINAFNEIRKIATSVRLTAINASVEAARAGDSGRGFSVIASEVKTHAEGIQAATENAQKVINTIIR